MRKESIRLDTTRWGRWYSGKCGRCLNLTIQTMIYAQRRICPEKWDAKNSLWFWDINGSPKLEKTTRPSDNQKKKKNSEPAEEWILPFRLTNGLNWKKVKKEISTYTSLENWNTTVIPVVLRALGTGTKWLGNQRMGGDHSNYSIVEIGKNTEKGLGDLRRLAVSHSREKLSANARTKISRKTQIIR